MKSKNDDGEKVDKLTAQYTVSVDNAKDLISSWLKKSAGSASSSNDKPQPERQSQPQSIPKPLHSSSTGLGFEKKSATPKTITHSSKALDSLKKRHQKQLKVKHGSVTKPGIAKKATAFSFYGNSGGVEDSSDSENEAGRSSLAKQKKRAQLPISKSKKKITKR